MIAHLQTTTIHGLWINLLYFLPIGTWATSDASSCSMDNIQRTPPRCSPLLYSTRSLSLFRHCDVSLASAVRLPLESATDRLSPSSVRSSWTDHCHSRPSRLPQDYPRYSSWSACRCPFHRPSPNDAPASRDTWNASPGARYAPNLHMSWWMETSL